ncbi:hypothetical protein Bbelb_148510 [Branchiostoma belcheri]|nr:hypothetical protein Bbelb_148510 [Branchiostoma belcheri]
MRSWRAGDTFDSCTACEHGKSPLILGKTNAIYLHTAASSRDTPALSACREVQEKVRTIHHRVIQRVLEARFVIPRAGVPCVIPRVPPRTRDCREEVQLEFTELQDSVIPQPQGLYQIGGRLVKLVVDLSAATALLPGQTTESAVTCLTNVTDVTHRQVRAVQHFFSRQVVPA